MSAQSEPTHLCFDGSLTIGSVLDACGRLRVALEASVALDVDCSGAAETDIAFLQLLLAACRSARADGKALTVRAAADGALWQAAARSGIDPAEFGLRSGASRTEGEPS